MTDALSFVHAADIHLGASFKGLSSSATIGQHLIDAVPDSFRSVISSCIENEVDFLVLSGDTFNEGVVSYAAQRCFLDGMRELDDAGIPVYLCMGNHDPLAGWDRLRPLLPENVHIFGSAPTYYLFEKRGIRVGIAGVSFSSRLERDDLSEGITRASIEEELGQVDLCIGVLHTGMTDPAYAPCSLGSLESSGIDYWALGHIHASSGVGESGRIYYAGSPQGLDINENHDHGCLLVSFRRASHIVKPDVTFVKTGKIAWEICRVDTTSTVDEFALEEVLVERGQELIAAHGTPVCVRFTLYGRSPLYDELPPSSTFEDLRTKVSSRCRSGSLWLWVDGIVNRTQPCIDVDQVRKSDFFPALIVEEHDAMEKDLSASCDKVLSNSKHSRAGVKSLMNRLDKEAALQDALSICLDELVGDRDE